ncbi:GGDEF domain-containing protein [Rhodococcus sp. BP-349]|uniref:GGDEF domain-containing protein n=1 Tax=unclassified Rhodococcus (in: high G+C Gram-positive bacteria) TaxID=192944 RepID=UPI001C9B6BA0|nr:MULTISPECIES: GGDEF domain-containing protein [unclassified Rhodococcus (in: high G+C Gram-positive bacteria)]MBY6537586.1 GGDEF domain-containing protein [Rhodococcus sp. BP-363]MBY6541923.1 GGDEF domain-containing protein [Rhodococcus sp. BP-369]MBY6561153.1 GGDEF domain-containing protein [Rhodococcus sp. BP-370]MBY6575445.1 GGDEF domain-containing protein [Rhodococcus sp. BP-364]MBY6584746.1 GGDEF domain-containing protein [Rhodococcus sp. BP-358]
MRVLREWWSSDIDYAWVANYHRTHAYLRTAPYLIAAACFLLAGKTAADLVTSLSSRENDGPWWVFVVGTVVSVSLGLAWARGGFLTERWSLRFVVIADVTIASVLLALPPSQIVVMSAALLVTIGNYANAFHGVRVFLSHELLALGLALCLFTRLVTDTPVALSAAVSTLFTVLVILFAASSLNHFFFTALRDDAARAFYDQLTGLRNRRGLLVDVGSMVRSARLAPVDDVTVVSAICLDLDAFKSVNDRYGHTIGDDVLRRAAARIGRVSFDAVSARIGGEEFLVVVAGDESRGPAVARALLHAIHRDDDATPISASIGVASMPLTHARDDTAVMLNSLLDRADAAMYEAKRQGGNRVSVAATGTDGVGGRRQEGLSL